MFIYVVASLLLLVETNLAFDDGKSHYSNIVNRFVPKQVNLEMLRIRIDLGNHCIDCLNLGFV